MSIKDTIVAAGVGASVALAGVALAPGASDSLTAWQEVRTIAEAQIEAATPEAAPEPAPAPRPTVLPERRSVGALVVDTPGVVSGVTASSVTITVSGVTLRGSTVNRSGDGHAIFVKNGVSGTVIEDVIIHLGDSCGGSGVAGGSDVTVVRTFIDGCGDGLKIVDGGTYIGNTIKVSKPTGNDHHLDGMQCSGCNDVVIKDNVVDIPGPESGPRRANMALFIQSWNGAREQRTGNILVEGNTFTGGGYTVMTEDGKTGSGWLYDVILRDNVISGGIYGKSGISIEGDVTVQ